MARLCTPETFVIVRTNNGDGAVNRKLGMFMDGFYYFPHYLHYFSTHSLTAVGRRAGLKPVLQRASEDLIPELADAALPPPAPGETNGMRFKRAGAGFETILLETAFVLKTSPYREDAQSLPAIATMPTTPAFEWDSHGDFFKQGSRWRQHRCRAGEYMPLDEMVYTTTHNYWYYGSAFICDHNLAHYDGEFLPLLSFDAPSSGIFEFELTWAKRHVQWPDATITMVLPDGGTEQFPVTSLAPVKVVRRATLEAGQCARFACESKVLPNSQRTICLIGVRRV